MKKSILFVCLGNICRSPAAEGVFLHQIKNKNLEDQFIVDSAGTGGWHVGNNADPRMRNAALKRGIEVNSKARKINLHDFQSFDLILTMDNSNLSDIQKLSSKVTNKNTAIIRPLLSYSETSKIIEVPDPYYGGDSGFDKVLDLLEEAIECLLLELTFKE
tara:strand:- start:54416 stop:54895 length:480 start_codon:yes stop_codon:yes gene_type:complete